jgi:hypothetical protein
MSGASQKPKSASPQKPKRMGKQRQQRRRQPKTQHGKAVAKTVRAVQRSLIPRVTQGSKLAASIATSMALPMNTNPVRLMYGGASRPTAVAKTHQIKDANWSVPPAGSLPMLKPGQYFTALSRSPLTHLITWDTNPDLLISHYKATFYADYNLANQGEIALLVGPTASWLHPVYLYDLYSNNSGRGHAYGDTEFPVTLEGHNAFFVTTSSSNAATVFLDVWFEPSTTQTSFTVDVMKITGGEWVVHAQSTCTITNPDHEGYQFELASTGYYALRIVFPAEELVVFAFSVAQSAPCFTFSPSTGYYTNHANIDAVRLNSTAILLSNRAPLLQQGGIVSIAQLPFGVDWLTECRTGIPVDTIALLWGQKTSDLKNGIYGFHRTEGLDDLKMIDYLSVLNPGSDVITDTNNPYYPPGGWIVIGASVTALDTKYPGGDCFITVFDHVEFRSTNLWFEQRSPSTKPEDLSHALEMLRGEAVQFHENPWHFKDIMSAIGNKFKQALKIAPQMLSAFGKFLPGARRFQPLVDAAASLIGD